MKKTLVWLVLVLCLALCASGAMAADLPFNLMVNGVKQSGLSGDGWSFENVPNRLLITKGGEYSISDWYSEEAPGEGAIYDYTIGEHDLTLNLTNVYLDDKYVNPIFVAQIGEHCSFTLNLLNSKLVSYGAVITYNHGKMPEVDLNIYGRNSEMVASAGLYMLGIPYRGTVNIGGDEFKITGMDWNGMFDAGIVAFLSEDDEASQYAQYKLILSGDVTIDATQKANGAVSGFREILVNDAVLYADEAKNRLLGGGMGLSGNLFDKANGEKVLSTKGLKPELPKTGDHSVLGVWIMLLGAAGAAMLTLKKRAHS